MGNATHGGKGDRDRTADKEKFSDNYDRIFRGAASETETDCAPAETEPEDAPLVQDQTKSSASEEIYNEVIEEIVRFLKYIESEEYPIQKARELYKKYLTIR